MKRMRLIISTTAFTCLIICLSIFPYSLKGQTNLIDAVSFIKEDSHWLDATIYDPFFYDGQVPKTIQVFIEVSDELYPDEHVVDDLTDYMRFAGNHSYEWVKATTVDVSPPEADTYYIATLRVDNPNVGKYLNNWGFDQKDNTLHVAIQYPDPDNEDGDWITELWNLDVHYIKPQVKFLQIMNGDYDGDPLVLKDPDSLAVNLRVFRDYDGGHPHTNIQALDGRRKGEGDWQEKIWEAGNTQQGVPDETIYFENILETLEIDQVQTGYTTFEFRSVGVCENCANGEYSEVISFDVFYMEINPGELTVIDDTLPEVEHADHFYKLEGSPPGGSFSGPGVVENTLFFNPMQEDVAVDDINTVHYAYPLWDGTDETREMYVSVVSTPFFAIKGEQEVCRNDTVRYDFPHSTPEPLLANQHLVGGSIHVSDSTYAYVIWHGDGAVDGEYDNQIGKIIYETDDGFRFDLYVDISKESIRTTPHLEQVSHDLLVCSDAGAVHYQWYSYDIHGFDMLIGEGEDAYLHLSPKMVSEFGLASGDSVWVETTNDPELAHACYSPSSLIELDFGQAQEAQASAVDAFPNPCVDQLTVRLDDPEARIQDIEILDIFGRVRHREAWPEGQREHTLSLQCSQMEQGIYLLRARGQNERHHQKLFIGN